MGLVAFVVISVTRFGATQWLLCAAKNAVDVGGVMCDDVGISNIFA
jgi:hypothetical protein